jgi:hypothetical protein
MLLVNWLRTDGPVVAQKIVGSVATPAFAALHKRAQTTASLAPFGTVLTHPAILPTESLFGVLALWLALDGSRSLDPQNKEGEIPIASGKS